MATISWWFATYNNTYFKGDPVRSFKHQSLNMSENVKRFCRLHLSATESHVSVPLGGVTLPEHVSWVCASHLSFFKGHDNLYTRVRVCEFGGAMVRRGGWLWTAAILSLPSSSPLLLLLLSPPFLHSSNPFWLQNKADILADSWAPINLFS